MRTHFVFDNTGSHNLGGKTSLVPALVFFLFIFLFFITILIKTNHGSVKMKKGDAWKKNKTNNGFKNGLTPVVDSLVLLL